MDARALGEHVDGIGRYSLGVMRALPELRPAWRLSVIASPEGKAHMEGIPVDVMESAVPRFRTSEHRRLFPLIEAAAPDCYLNFSMAGPMPRVPTVLTVHDIMVLTVPGYFGGSTLRNLLARLLFRRRLKASIAHADSIAVPSRYSLDEIAAVFPGSAGKAFVTGEGQDLFPEPPGLNGSRDDYILYVGNARAYKNVTRLVVAWSRLRAMNGGFPELRMVVRRDRAFDGFMREVEDSPARDSISVLSHVDDCALRKLYMKCGFLVMPSLKEGFGLPALEAMAAGAPVVVSGGTALEELTGEAAVLVDPLSVEDIMRGMALMASDPSLREELSRMSAGRASLFTWEKTASRMVKRIEEITG